MTRASAVVTGLVFMLSGMVHAAEITVLSGGAVEPGLHAAARAFEKQTGHTVKITFNTTPQIRKRVGAGETFDVVIVPPAAVKDFAAAGKVEAGGVDIGKVGMGVVIRPGAPVPDIANAEAIKRTVLEAESIVFNRASSGLYFEGLLKKMGVYEQIEAKAARYATGAEVMEHVLKGKGKEVGFGPITEILQYRDKGLRLVGPLPAEINSIVMFTAGVSAASPNQQAARDLIKLLKSPGAKPVIKAKGNDPA